MTIEFTSIANLLNSKLTRNKVYQRIASKLHSEIMQSISEPDFGRYDALRAVREIVTQAEHASRNKFPHAAIVMLQHAATKYRRAPALRKLEATA